MTSMPATSLGRRHRRTRRQEALAPGRRRREQTIQAPVRVLRSAARWPLARPGLPGALRRHTVARASHPAAPEVVTPPFVPPRSSPRYAAPDALPLDGLRLAPLESLRFPALRWVARWHHSRIQRAPTWDHDPH